MERLFRQSWVRAGVALMLGIVGFSVGMALHVLITPQGPMPGVEPVRPIDLVASNLFGAIPFVAVALGLTMLVWSNRGAPFYPAWVLPAFLCLLVGGVFAFQAFSNPGSLGTGFQLTHTVPLALVRPLVAGILGGAAMQMVQWRPAA